MKSHRLFILLAAAMLASCASPARHLPALAANKDDTAYLLGPGDMLRIVVYGEPDLSGSFRIAENGSLAIPLVGQVNAQGLSLEELQRRLVTILGAKAIKSPDVTVQVDEYRPFFILGEVKTPGSYTYVPDMTVLTAVAIAGGFTFRAQEDSVSITRKRDGTTLESRAVREARVLPGDVVYVFERHF
jgi:polysaccharide export outer membrane protein